jgi:ADP-ribosylglycohydrolase
MTGGSSLVAMRSRPSLIVSLLGCFALLLTPAADASNLRGSQVRDKIAGGWLGAVIGGAWGRPTEFRFKGRIVPPDRVPRWSVARANRYTYRRDSDETYVEIPFLDATLRAGAGAGWAEWGQALAASDFKLFFANGRARENLRAGIPAPLSGDPVNNPYASDIDFQIESDWIGLATPDQPGAAVDLAWRVGHVTSYGDGVYGGVMIAAMHAAAFRAHSVREIVEAGRQAVPDGTTYRAMIEDTVRWHARHPRDWKATWRWLERRWNAHSTQAKHTATNSEFNVDAKLNGAYVLLGLLYGHGDFARTIRVSMRAGQDSDCNPSNAASILGTWLGQSRIPHRYRHGISHHRRFPDTDYTLKQAIAANVEVAREIARFRGGGAGGEGWDFAPSPVHPAPLEQWAPTRALAPGRPAA